MFDFWPRQCDQLRLSIVIYFITDEQVLMHRVLLIRSVLTARLGVFINDRIFLCDDAIIDGPIRLT